MTLYGFPYIVVIIQRITNHKKIKKMNDKNKKETLLSIFEKNYKDAVAKWLKDNRNIGQLNSGKYYNSVTLEEVECPVQKETLNHTWGRA